MPVNGQVLIHASVQETMSLPENRVGSIFDTIVADYTFTNGTGAGESDLVFSDRRTVGAGATDTIDLNGGGLTDAYGNAVNFVEVTSVVIRNRETTLVARTIQFGPNAGGNPFLWLFADASDLVSVKPGGGYCQWADQAQTVSAGSADTIRIVNTDGANTVTYDILVTGRSA